MKDLIRLEVGKEEFDMLKIIGDLKHEEQIIAYNFLNKHFTFEIFLMCKDKIVADYDTLKEAMEEQENCNSKLGIETKERFYIKINMWQRIPNTIKRKYKCIEDLQLEDLENGLAINEVHTAEEWLEKAKDWLDNGHSSKLINTLINITNEDELIAKIEEIWKIRLKEEK